jgi:hypothetical protein
LLAGALAGPVACRWEGLPAPGRPPDLPVPSPVIAIVAAGLVCYTMFFLVCEAALLVLAVINIQDEKVHNKYKSLMLLVLYVFTFRYRQVLPVKFFAEPGVEAESAPVGGGPRKARKRRLKRREISMSPESPSPSPPASPPVTDEEIRAFALLITRMATVLGDDETVAGRAPATDDTGPDRLFVDWS